MSRVYVFCIARVAVGCMFAREFMYVPKCLSCARASGVAMCIWSWDSLLWVVIMVFMLACSGAILLYDQAILEKLGMFVFVGAFVMRTVHFAALRPSVVTMEKSPPVSTYHCSLSMSCFMVVD